MAACDDDSVTKNVAPAGTITFGAYAADGSSFTVSLTTVHPTGSCVDEITYQWTVPAYAHENAPRTNAYLGTCQSSVTKTVAVPTRDGGGTLHFRLSATKETASKKGYETTLAWASVAIPAYTGGAAPPLAVVFANASPAGDGGKRLLDARLSTGDGVLSYAWSPQECAGTSYESGSGGVAALAGTAGVAPNYSGECTVTVTKEKNGAYASASATVSVSSIRGLRNGFFTFNNSTTATISGSYYGLPGEATTACVDLAGTGSYSKPVALTGTNPSTGTVTLESTGPGVHKIAATLWSGGDNANCAITSTTGAVQTIADLYFGTTLTRAGRTASYAAPSSLRFSPTTTISGGVLDNDTLSLKGATLGGSFLWSTPASAGGVKRPAGAAKLAKGTFVMRSIDMVQGPLVGKASTLLGTGTVLLRGADGTLACGKLAGGFDSSTLMLSGGTRSARTLAGNVTGKQVTYVFPTVPAAAARSGGASGMLATALDWLTGDQPAERAKKPAKKPKLPKVKPVTASGTASLQTAAKPAGLPASCKALVQYLPQ
jgi:hypothetical protein